MEKLGHVVEIAALDAPDAPYLSEIPCQVYPLGPGRTSYGYSSKFVPWLKKHSHRYDCVVVNGIWQFNSFGVWLALHKTKLPYFVFTHGMLDPWFKRTYPLKHIKKWLYWPWGEYRVLRDARAVLFTSESERVLARQSFWLYECEEKVIAYGTAAPKGNPETQRESFVHSYPGLVGKRIILFLSRIHVKKGCDILLQAFNQVARHHPSLHLVMAGPDQTGWQITLEALAKSLGIADRITWTGMLQGDLKWGAFFASEAFILPSHQENFGIAVAEALACGLPVLISNQINIWQEIVADQAGFVGDDTVAGTVDVLRCWLSLTPEEQQAMGQRAKACFASRFEIHQATTAFLETIQAYL